MKKIGLALSGGGARAIAHLGIMKALEAEGITFSKISGSSAGAVIAALYAGGMTPDEIYQKFVSLKLWSLINPIIPNSGFLSMSNAEKLIKENLPVKTFEELKIEICVSATDLEKGVSSCFTKGDLIKPLLASCCVPVLYKPVELEGRRYIDGGILNNLPVDLIKEDVDFVIGLHSNPIHPSFKPSGVKSMIERSFMMAVTCNVYARKHLCDIFIEPPALGTYKIMDFGKAEEIFDIGYTYAKENMSSFGLEKIKDDTHDIRGADSTRNT
ncbi:MAG: patatin-like phospholipase family protein [Candidatus Cyclobacteriaceae bacterium M2_1C_046]